MIVFLFLLAINEQRQPSFHKDKIEFAQRLQRPVLRRIAKEIPNDPRTAYRAGYQRGFSKGYKDGFRAGRRSATYWFGCLLGLTLGPVGYLIALFF